MEICEAEIKYSACAKYESPFVSGHTILGDLSPLSHALPLLQVDDVEGETVVSKRPLCDRTGVNPPEAHDGQAVDAQRKCSPLQRAPLLSEQVEVEEPR